MGVWQRPWAPNNKRQTYANMKLLDYTGLARLTANIKSYIADKLQPIDDRTPYCVEGMCYMLGTYFLSPGSAGSISTDMCPTTATPVTLTPSSTGNAKKLYDRLAKGLPSALMMPVSSIQVLNFGGLGSWPFLPDSEGVTAQVNGSNQITTVMYRCAINRGTSGYMVLYDLKVVITRLRSNPNQPTKIEIWAVEVPEPAVEVDDTPLLPFHAQMYSVDANGTVSPSGTRTVSSSSTGGELAFYNRLQKGLPPAIRVDVTLSDGSTTRPVWLYLDTMSGAAGSVMYKSGTLANGTYSNKYLRLNIAQGASTKVALSLLNVG